MYITNNLIKLANKHLSIDNNNLFAKLESKGWLKRVIGSGNLYNEGYKEYLTKYCNTLITFINKCDSNPENNYIKNIINDINPSKTKLLSDDGIRLGKDVHYLSNLAYTNLAKNNSKVYKLLVEVLTSNSNNSCLVGGCVRDSVLGKEPKDYDFVTDITYDKLKVLLEKEKFYVKNEGKEFLVLICSKDGEQFEIANYRKDGTYEDGRKPTSVDIGTIYEDAMRRDLTVNALYYNLTTSKLIDPTGLGIQDIINKTLRFVGKPKDRIKEDNLRAWRFIRFLNTLDGFKADTKSNKAIKEYWKTAYDNSNPQRVLQEIQKMVKEF